MSTLIKDMVQSAVHFGHKTQKWNPRMAPYLYGEKNGIHIFDLNETAACLEKALTFLKSAADDGKRFLFVSTKPQSTRFIKEAAEKIEIGYVVKKWIPGLLTNFDTLKGRIGHLKKYKEMRDSGELEKYTKKEIAKITKEIEKLEAALGGVQEMAKLPDVLVVFDVTRDSIAVSEAKKLGIKVVGLCDSNANPQAVDYPIPGNDDAVKSLELFIGLITDAIAAPKKK